MARQILPIAGAFAGSFFGSPQLGFAIGSIIGNIVDPQRIKGPRLDEVPVQTANEGGYRQVVYGTCWINATNIIDFGDVDSVIVEERQGKGGGPIVESERLYRTYAIGLGEPLAAVRVIRKDGKIVYDVRAGSELLAESAKFAERFRFYTGAEDQLPDPDLEALPHNGVGNTPHYRGTAYLVFPRDDLTDRRGSIPTYEVEGLAALGDVVTAGASIITNDAIYLGPYASLTGATGGRDVTGGVDQAFSVTADGIYLAGGREIAPRFAWWKWDQDSGEYIKQTDPSGLPTSGSVRYTAWDESGRYLAVLSSAISGAERLLVFKRTGDTLSKLSFSGTWDPTAGSASGLAITSINGLRAAYTGPSGKLVMHNIISDVILNGIESAEASTNSAGMQFSPGANFMVSSVSGPGVVVWDVRSPSSPATIFDSVAVDSGVGVKFSPNGGYVYAIPSASGDITVYSFNAAAIVSEALEFVSTVPIPAMAAAFSEAEVVGGRYLATTLTNSDPGETVYLWEISNGDESVLTPIASQPVVGTQTTTTTLASPARSTSTVLGPNAISLAALVTDICERCGLPASKIDVTALTDEVLGVTLGGPYDGAGATTTLMPAYLFDLFDADKKLRFPKRGAAVVATITDADLIDEPDENMLRGQDIEYPRSLLLKYLNPGQNYAAPAAVVSRTSPDIRVSGEASADLPISFNETQALNVANRMLQVMWEDLNGEVVLSLPAGPFAWLTPSDNLGLSLRGAVYRVRVEQAETAGGILKLTARRDRQSAYTSNLTAIPLPAPTPPPPSLAGATQFVVLNIPGIVDGDDPLLGIRVGVSGLGGFAWSGCSVRLSSDAGVTWDTIATITTRARIGNLLAALPAASPHYTDTTNPMDVLMLDDRDLEAVTQAQFLSEGNGAAIARSDGSAELIQFRDVTDEGANEWTLETLLRGRLDTSPAAHLAGAKFVMLDGTVFIPLSSSLIGQPLVLQFVSAGTSPEVAPTFSFTWDPVAAQTEFPAAHLFLARATDTINATAVPRHRFGTEDAPIASVNFDGYRWTATDGVNSLTSDTALPANSFDATGWATPVTVTVALINRITGAGPTITEAIA